MTTLTAKGVEPTSPDEPTSLAYLKKRPSSGLFPSDTANNYYSAVKSINPNRASDKGISSSIRTKKTLSTLIAEALTVSMSPRSPKMEEEPEHIPPVSSFQHDDALTTCSSVTTPSLSKVATRNSAKTFSPGCSVITEQEEENPASPGNTVLSTVTEMASVKSGSSGSKSSKLKSSVGSVLRKVSLSPGSIKTEKGSVVTEKKVLSPGSTHMSIKTEKASVQGSVQTEKVSAMSVKADKALSVTTEKASIGGAVKGQKIKNGTPKRSDKASSLPPKPMTVMDFAKNKDIKKSSMPLSLGIPDLTQGEKQTVRSESPATPRVSNSRAVIGQNLSFSYPVDKKMKTPLTSVRSMSPSLEKTTAVSNEAASARAKFDDNKNSDYEDPPLDSIGSAIVITDLLSVTRGNSCPETEKMKKETIEPTNAHDTKTTIDVGQEVVMSPSMEKKSNHASQDKSKTTLLQKAFSFSSRSVSSKTSRQSAQQNQLITPSASKDCSNSSKNPASDGSTAASTVSGRSSSGSISSNESKDQGNFSETATECTMRVSNTAGKSIGKSLSFSYQQKEKASVKTARSMSPSLRLRSKCLAVASKTKDERESIASAAVKDKSLPPLAPKHQLSVVTSKLETATDSKSEADDVSVEVVGVVGDAAVGFTDCDTSSSAESDVKRRQKIKMGRLLRSRQTIRQKISSSSSSSITGSKNNEIPPFEPVSSDNVSTQASTIQKEDTAALVHYRSNEFNSLSELIAVAEGPTPRIAEEKSISNEMDIYADLSDPVPISQIDFVQDPNPVQDDIITLDPDLSNEKPKHQIWHEDEDIDKPTRKGRYSCGVDTFRHDDSSASVDFFHDDFSEDGKKKKSRKQPLACGADELAEEIGIEMKSAASEVFHGVKKASISAARALFGICDITADGGVEYLAEEMNATQHQLVTGELPQKKVPARESPPTKRDKGMPTAEEALEEALQKKVEQRKTAYLNKRYKVPSAESGMTIVERQEQVRKQREKEEIEKKKRHIHRLKNLSMKHF